MRWPWQKKAPCVKCAKLPDGTVIVKPPGQPGTYYTPEMIASGKYTPLPEECFDNDR